jgi:pimeloyl-ACP methyl ester carboxylesterase
MADIRGPDVAAALGGLVPDVDKAVITGAFGDFLAESLRSAVRHGIEGWRDDDLAFAVHWGFELAAITVPVAVWQGGADLMVPFAHGSWLAEHVPGARPHLAAEHGHLSLLVGNVEAILGDLVGLGESAGAR